MLGGEFIVVAIILRVAAGLGYLIATWRGVVQPNPVSWLFWGMTPLVAFAAQVQDGPTPQAWVTLTLGASPLLVFVLSVARKSRWRVGRFDALCGGFAALGVVLWQITSDPVHAILFSILADVLASIPTLLKAYRAPSSERALPYFVSMVSMTVTLLTVSDWKLMEFAFPLYILLINTSIFGVVRLRSTQLRGRPRAGVSRLPRPPAALPVAVATGGPALAADQLNG
jgi:hypothetical protein